MIFKVQFLSSPAPDPTLGAVARLEGLLFESTLKEALDKIRRAFWLEEDQQCSVWPAASLNLPLVNFVDQTGSVRCFVWREGL